MKHSEAGIDYIRLTAAHGPAAQHLRIVGEQLLDLEGMSGHKQEQRSRLGYRGWSAGRVFVGENEEGWMLDVSGALAGHPYIRAGCEGWRCTRIDVQLTTPTEGDVSPIIEAAAQAAVVCRLAARQGRPYKITHILGKGAGDTLNLGSRSSQVYGRIYDKGSQSKDERYKGMVRYEVEFKQEMARSIFAGYADATNDGRYSRGVVVGSFARWGIVPIGTEGVQPVVPEQSRTETSTARRLRWLREQVGPTLEGLISDGYGVAALTALGLGGTLSEQDLQNLLEQSGP